MVPQTTVWFHRQSYGSTDNRMVPQTTVWLHRQPYGSTDNRMAPQTTVFFFFILFDTNIIDESKIDKTVDNRYITQFWAHYIHPLIFGFAKKQLIFYSIMPSLFMEIIRHIIPAICPLILYSA